MESSKKVKPQHQVPSCTTSNMAYSTAAIPYHENHATLSVEVYGACLNGGLQEDPSSSALELDYHSYFDGFPAGVRFRPTDIELIHSYLKPKVEKREVASGPIRDANLYMHSPDELAEMYQELKQDECLFFTPRNRKYPRGDRPNRAIAGAAGFWKATGADKPIKDDNGKTIGSKQSLVYYIGGAKNGVKTNWIMHEYCLSSEIKKRKKKKTSEIQKKKKQASEIDMRLDEFVLCRIYKKGNKSFQDRKEVEPQVLKSEVSDACGGGAPQELQNMQGFGDIGHSSRFGNGYENNVQNSQLGFCKMEDQDPFRDLDDLLILNDNSYSMLKMDNPNVPFN